MAKKGFVYKALYGKDKKDFTINDYPRNRFEAFFKLLKSYFLSWIMLSLLTLLFSLPVILLFFAKSAYIADKSNNIPEEQLLSLRMSSELVFGSIAIPLWLLLFVGLQGVLGIIRKMVFREGYLFFPDFIESIKKGYKNALLLGVMFSIFSFIANLDINFLGLDIWPATWLKYGIFVIVIIIFVFSILISLIGLSLNCIYDLSFKDLLKNAFLLSFGKLFKNLFFLLATIWPIVLIIISPNLLVLIIASAFLGLLFYAIILTIWFLYMTSIFDTFINKEHCPSIYRKGLRSIKDVQNND